MKKALNIFFTIFLSIVYYLVVFRFYDRIQIFAYFSHGLSMLVIGFIFFFLVFMINSLTSEEYSLADCLKNWKIIPIFMFVSIWGFFAFGEKIFRIVYLVTYWISYLVVEFVINYGRTKSGSKSIQHMTFSTFLLLYFMWIAFLIILSVPVFIVLTTTQIKF